MSQVSPSPGYLLCLPHLNFSPPHPGTPNLLYTPIFFYTVLTNFSHNILFFYLLCLLSMVCLLSLHENRNFCLLWPQKCAVQISATGSVCDHSLSSALWDPPTCGEPTLPRAAPSQQLSSVGTKQAPSGKTLYSLNGQLGSRIPPLVGPKHSNHLAKPKLCFGQKLFLP